MVRITVIQYEGLKSGAGFQETEVLPDENLCLAPERAVPLGINSGEFALRVTPDSRDPAQIEFSLAYPDNYNDSLLLSRIDLNAYRDMLKRSAMQHVGAVNLAIEMVNGVADLREVWTWHNEAHGVTERIGAGKLASTFEADFLTAFLASSLVGIIEGSDEFWERLGADITLLYTTNEPILPQRMVSKMPSGLRSPSMQASN